MITPALGHHGGFLSVLCICPLLQIFRQIVFKLNNTRKKCYCIMRGKWISERIIVLLKYETASNCALADIPWGIPSKYLLRSSGLVITLVTYLLFQEYISIPTVCQSATVNGRKGFPFPNEIEINIWLNILNYEDMILMMILFRQSFVFLIL